MNVKELKQIPFFFIVGTARSGTTMLQQILDSNPNLILPIESKFIIHLKKIYAKENNWTHNKINALLDDLYKERHFKQYWELNRADLKNKIDEIPKGELSFALICKLIYISYPSIYPKEKINLIGDKNPIYAIYIDLLKEIFPDAKFIHIIRDYRPNALSNSLAFVGKSIPFFAAQWKLHNQLIEKQKAISPASFYTIQYENIVNEPEKYVKEICEFLEIEYNSAMLDFYIQTNKSYKDKGIEGFERFHQGVLKPISATDIDSWKQKISAEQIETIEYIAGDFGEKYGYDKIANTNKSFFFKSWRAKWNCKKEYFVLRTYYTMPAFMRRSISYMTVGLYKLFKFKHPYNKHDIDVVEDSKK
jgi:hypothetical protein